MKECIKCGIPFANTPWIKHRQETKCIKDCCRECCVGSFGNCYPEKPIPKTEEEKKTKGNKLCQ